MITLGQKEKFVIIIGEEGAVLAYLSGKTLVNRLFASSAEVKDRKEFDKLFRKYPKAAIHILVDSIEQSYTRQVLPAVSPLSIGKLVKKRLERDFTASDMKAALYHERSEKGRRDWIYMFISTPVNDGLSQWLDYLTTLTNPFGGVYMLPLEVQNLAARIKSMIFTSAGVSKQSDWQLLVMHNKTGGFRQVVLHTGNVLFTGMVQLDKETRPGVIAGNVEQEVLNTVDYMRRLSFKDDDALDLVIIASEEIKKNLIDVKMRGKEVITFTPHEIAQKLGFANVTTDNDKFADLIIAASFAGSKPVLKFFTPTIKFIYAFNMVTRGIKLATITLFPLLALYAVFLGYRLIDSVFKVEDISNEKARIERKWKEAQKTDQYNLDDAGKITDAVAMHQILSAPGLEPLDFFSHLAAAQDNYALLVSGNWHATRVDALKKENKGSVYAPELQSRSILNLQFYNSGETVEELFTNYDAFTTRLKEEFSDSIVEYSKLPDRISFSEQNKDLDVQVTVNYPQNEKKKE